DGIRADLVTGVQTCALPISLPPRYLLQVPRIHQQHREAALQDVVNRFPKHAGRFHRHLRDALRGHPIGHRQKVPGHRAPMACLLMPTAVCSIRRTQASTDSLWTSKPAQQGKMFSMIVSSTPAPEDIESVKQSAPRALAEARRQLGVRSDVQARLFSGLEAPSNAGLHPAQAEWII